MPVPKHDTIFTVTCKKSQGKSRCWGYFFTLPEAKHAAETNQSDIGEDGYYDYLVIEQYQPGIMRIAHQIEWYRWNKDRWEPCKRPADYDQLVNFAMS